MKKVLTVLLTLVMAVCLININQNISKAENEDPDYLTLTANQNSSTVRLNGLGDRSSVQPGLQYRKYTSNTSTWSDWADYTTSSGYGIQISLSANDKVQFKTTSDKQTFSTSGDNCYKFVMSGSIAASGNVMSLIYTDFSSDSAKVIPNNYCFSKLFFECSSLTSAPKLPATTLTEGCYWWMFRGTSIKQAPVLPATTLAKYCYFCMFYGCAQLEKAPALPATILKDNCYECMFEECSSLTEPADLNHVTEVAEASLVTMYYKCTSLKIYSSPQDGYKNEWAINATNPSESTYWSTNMFTGCSAAVTVALNTTYYVKGEGIKNLSFTATTANSKVELTKVGSPDAVNLEYRINGGEWADYVPGTTGEITLTNVNDNVSFRAKTGGNNTFSKDSSNYYKFVTSGTGIKVSGNINSLLSVEGEKTTIPDYCFYNLFNGCSTITSAPDLPATTIGVSAYEAMFKGCSSLEETPTFKATTLSSRSCYQMFENCTTLTAPISISSITTLGADASGVGCMEEMFKGCSSIKVYEASKTDYERKWIVPNLVTTSAANFSKNMFNGTTGDFTANPAVNTTYYVKGGKYLTITAGENNVTVKLQKWNNPDAKLQYSKNNGEWIDYTYNNNITLNNKDDYVQFKAKSQNTSFSSENSGAYFVISGKAAASGSVMSLLDSSCQSKIIPTAYCFYQLFKGCSSLTSAPELPATTLTDYCYENMFNSCSSLKSAPALPATTLTKYCYKNMFSGCTSLETPPALPATVLKEGCYYIMFSGTALEEPVDLSHVTTVADSSMYGMYYQCSSLKIYSSQQTGYKKVWKINATNTGSATNWAAYMFESCGASVSSVTANTPYYIKGEDTEPTPSPGPGDMPYDDTKGFNATITKGSASTLTAHITNVKKGTDTVAVKEGDTTLVLDTDYKIESGSSNADSIKVVLQPVYLKDLTEDTTLKIIINGTKEFKVTITVNNPSPTPSPSPSKKDESCEKVIGPTWHWNESKGICEDVGVVGTTTR